MLEGLPPLVPKRRAQITVGRDGDLAQAYRFWRDVKPLAARAGVELFLARICPHARYASNFAGTAIALLLFARVEVFLAKRSRRRELPAFHPPPDGCRFEKRIRDLQRSLREERRALRQADAFYRRLAFRYFEPTLLAQPRIFPTKPEQLLVGAALDDTAVIKYENLICVHDSGKPVRDYDRSAVEH